MTSAAGEYAQTTPAAKKPTLYLSGPMTGRPDFNYPAFNHAAARLRNDGYGVLNPAENFDGATDLPREEYMRRDIEQVLHADAVAVLPGWDLSQGSCLEVAIARELGLPVYDAMTMREVSAEPFEFSDAKEPRTILDEAARITSRDRQDVYGHPADDFAKTIGMLNALLSAKLREPLTLLDLPQIMVCLKLARLAKSPDHRDSWVDVAGYARTAELVMERARSGTQ